MLFWKLPTCIKTQIYLYTAVVDFLRDWWAKIFVQISVTRNWYLRMHYWISLFFINLIKTHICKFNDVWFHSSLCYFGNYPLALKPRFIHSLLLLIFCLIGGLRFSVTRNWYLYMMHYWISLFFINLIKTHDCLFNDARFHSTLCYLGNYPLAFKPRFIHSLLLLIFCVIGGLRFCANFSY